MSETETAATNPSRDYFNMRAYDIIRPFIKQFEQAVWFRTGLANYIRKSKARGHSGETNGVRILAWSCAGRTLITMTQQKDFVTLAVATDQDTPSMGLHATSMEGAQLIRFLEEIEKVWPSLVPDDEVRFPA